jgi:hypothetical protein
MDPTTSTAPIAVARIARALAYLVYASTASSRWALRALIAWLSTRILEMRVDDAAARGRASAA